MGKNKNERDYAILFQHLKQKGFSTSEIEEAFEKAFGNSAYDIGENIEGTPEEEEFDAKMIAEGWGFLYNKNE